MFKPFLTSLVINDVSRCSSNFSCRRFMSVQNSAFKIPQSSNAILVSPNNSGYGAFGILRALFLLDYLFGIQNGEECRTRSISCRAANDSNPRER